MPHQLIKHSLKSEFIDMKAQKTDNRQVAGLNHIPDQLYLHLLDKVDFRPVFIMGDHRSGTTLLYKVLVATECFNFVKAYHVIKYDEILSSYMNQTENNARQELDKLLKSLGMKDRMIDNVEVTPDLPEEYGFILNNAGYKPHLIPENLSVFIELCKKIQFVSAPDRLLLLKNPWDFSNFMYIKSVLPEARFIFIHRHPINVINSKLKGMRSTLATRNAYIALLSQGYTRIFNRPVQHFFYRMLYSSYFNLALQTVTKQTVEGTTYFLQHLDSLPKADYISLKYEDLCEDAEATILNILGFLGLEPRATLAYDSLISPRSIKLLPEVQRKYDQVRQKMESYFIYHGYDD